MSHLWHYTCDHGHEQIERAAPAHVVPAAALSPQIHHGPSILAWFTDLDSPIRDALGLTSQILSCDRTAHRYRVTDGYSIVPWVEVRRLWLWADELESAPGAMPRHWFVASVPVPVVYDPVLAVAS